MNPQKTIVDMILKYLEGKGKLSPLEKDIFEISQLDVYKRQSRQLETDRNATA